LEENIAIHADLGQPKKDLANFSFTKDRLPIYPSLPSWMPQDVLDQFVEAYKTSGFRGGINYYRCFLSMPVVSLFEVVDFLIPSLNKFWDVECLSTYLSCMRLIVSKVILKRRDT